MSVSGLKDLVHSSFDDLRHLSRSIVVVAPPTDVVWVKKYGRTYHTFAVEANAVAREYSRHVDNFDVAEGFTLHDIRLIRSHVSEADHAKLVHSIGDQAAVY